MDRATIEQFIFDLDQRISELVAQRDHLRALLTLSDQLDAVTSERLAVSIVSAVKAKAAEIDGVAAAPLNIPRPLAE